MGRSIGVGLGDMLGVRVKRRWAGGEGRRIGWGGVRQPVALEAKPVYELNGCVGETWHHVGGQAQEPERAHSLPREPRLPMASPPPPPPPLGDAERLPPPLPHLPPSPSLPPPSMVAPRSEEATGALSPVP